MGELVGGVWRRGGIDGVLKDGEMRRPPASFRNRIDPSGAFPPERGRYHLYVSLACPWANRTLIMRNLKGLQDVVSLSVTHWLMGEDGWSFEPGAGVVPDDVNGTTFLHELYTLSDPTCTSRVSVPVLWDKVSGTIVSNESAEIIRMFNSAFDAVGAAKGDYYPIEHRTAIDAVNQRVYDTLNNGVYRAGFARSQAAYDAAVREVFDTLDWLEASLDGASFLIGGRLTEADIRLFTTLIRFDVVYHGHFKCNWRLLAEYPTLSAYLRRLYAIPEFYVTVNFDHIKQHYYRSHPWINPYSIVPIGPHIGLLETHEGE